MVAFSMLMGRPPCRNFAMPEPFFGPRRYGFLQRRELYQQRVRLTRLGRFTIWQLYPDGGFDRACRTMTALGVTLNVVC
jgi:hypothetical protein